MSNTDNTLEIGLALTRRGFAIFPVNARDKTPLFQGWPEKATKDVAGWRVMDERRDRGHHSRCRLRQFR